MGPEVVEDALVDREGAILGCNLLGLRRRRRSPKLHEVHTRDPRYHMGSFLRGVSQSPRTSKLPLPDPLYAFEKLPLESELIRGYLSYRGGQVEARLTREEWQTLQVRLRGADAKLRKEIIEDLLSGVERLPRYRVRHAGPTHIHYAFDYPPMFRKMK